MKISKFIIVLFVSFLPISYVSAEVTELSIDSSTCWLKERGAAIKENPISITGVKNESGCMAFIPKNYISQNFKFCAYSGFEIAGGKEAGYYSCSISSEGENFMFRAYMAEIDSKRQPDLICRFMCYSK